IAIFLGIVCSVSSFSQSGRFEEAKRRAAAYLDGGEYDRAAARLEEVWEQDQSDAAVAEGLAIAYLNGGDRTYRQGLEPKAQHLLQETIRLGGMATFIVQHSHGKFRSEEHTSELQSLRHLVC